MPRALAILKYVPAVLCGLLVVAWVVSVFASFGASFQQRGFNCKFATLKFWNYPEWNDYGIGIELLESTDYDTFREFHRGRYVTGLLGRQTQYVNDVAAHDYSIPIPGILTLLAPVALGPFTRFRFPLWSYFAGTALVAAELAYYLR
jgi:hypothetical protein